MGVIFGTMFFLMFTPTKWVHHFGLFAAVGAAMAALATVLVSPTVLRWSRNRMAFLSAVFFLLALCFATTNGWWYVSSYGVPFNNAMPKIGGITISTVFFALFAITAVYAVWLHFVSGNHGEGRIARALTAAPIPLAAGFMVVVFVGSMLVGVVRQYPTYSNAWANLRAFAGGCGLADDVLVEPDPNNGFLRPVPGDYGPLGPLGGVDPVGFTPNGVPEHIVAEVDSHDLAAAGHRLRLGRADQAVPPGVNGSTVPLPYGLNPAQHPWRAASSDGPQQQSRLTSAWYELPPADDGHPLVVVTAAGTISGYSVFNGYTEGQTVELEYGASRARRRAGAGRTAGALRPGTDPVMAQPAVRPVRIPADAVAVRVVAEDLSLTPGDWVAVTPPRVPELRSVQEYVGSSQPVLMDWAVGLAFPCQQPM